MINQDLIRNIKNLELKIKGLASESLSGEYASAFKGKGLSFEEVREYVPGDDVRAIDWHITAKMQRPFIKVMREEREQTVFVLVDISPSMNLATRGISKLHAAREFAVLVSYLASKNNDRVGLATFAQEPVTFIPPTKGRGHLWRLMSGLLEQTSVPAQNTQIHNMVDYFFKMQKKRAYVFLISDFLDPDLEKPLKFLAMRHDLTCVNTRDVREQHIPAGLGIIQVRDLESGDEKTLNFCGKNTPGLINKDLSQRLEALKNFTGRHNIDLIEVLAHEDVSKPLVSYLRRREAGKARHR